MFYRRVQACELGLLVEHLLFVVVHNIVELLLHVYNIDQIAVSIEILAGHLQFQGVMRRIGIIFRSPIPADEKMSCNEITLHAKGIHFNPPVLVVNLVKVIQVSACRSHKIFARLYGLIQRMTSWPSSRVISMVKSNLLICVQKSKSERGNPVCAGSRCWSASRDS